MNLTEAIYRHSLNLPENAAREALDFIEQRYAPTSTDTNDTNDTEAFLTAIEGGLSEDFPDDISDADLGTDAHRETLDL